MNNYYNSDTDIILIGAGGHAKVIIETIGKYYKHYNLIGITDNDETKINQTWMGIPILGDDSILRSIYEKGVRKAFISLGTVKEYIPRLNVITSVKKIGFQFVNIIHGSSIVSDNVKIGEGNAILAGAIINIDTAIGDNCIINSGSIIEHDCVVGNNVHIATGAKIAGQVKIGDNCMIGIGACVKQSVNIGKNSVIGAGCIVIKDIPENSIVVGVPAKIIGSR